MHVCRDDGVDHIFSAKCHHKSSSSLQYWHFKRRSIKWKSSQQNELILKKISHKRKRLFKLTFCCVRFLVCWGGIAAIDFIYYALSQNKCQRKFQVLNTQPQPFRLLPKFEKPMMSDFPTKISALSVVVDVFLLLLFVFFTRLLNVLLLI